MKQQIIREPMITAIRVSKRHERQQNRTKQQKLITKTKSIRYLWLNEIVKIAYVQK